MLPPVEKPGQVEADAEVLDRAAGQHHDGELLAELGEGTHLVKQAAFRLGQGSRTTARPPPRRRGWTKLKGSEECTVGWLGFLPTKLKTTWLANPISNWPPDAEQLAEAGDLAQR